MRSDRAQAAVRTIRVHVRLGLIGALVSGLATGCDRGAAAPPSNVEPQTPPPTTPQKHLPVYEVASEAREAYPEVAAFVDEFLNICLVGDYVGYRRLVSRAYAPESRERFEGIYHATEAVTVESIEPIKVSRVPAPVYRVISAVDFSPEQQVKLRETHRTVAILVFKEDGEWRMAPAPAELQPRDELPPPATSAPTTSAPTYPWDEDGDY